MKKLLVAVLALTTLSAFAGNSMVRMDGCFDGTCDTLDFDMATDDVKDAEGSDLTIALNYAMAFGGNWGAGITYVSKNNTTDGDVTAVGDKMNTIGLSGYYNMAGSWEDTCFFALHYAMTTNDDTDAVTDSGNKQTDITLEYGHRFTVGSLMGMSFSWVPSVAYVMGTTVQNNDNLDDVKTTNLTLNVANVAMTF